MHTDIPSKDNQKLFYIVFTREKLGFPGSSAGKESACRRPQFDSWVWNIPWRRDRLPTPAFLGFPGGSVGKKSAYNVGDLGSIPGLGKSPGGGNGNPIQYSCLENPHGERGLVCCSPWGLKESDVTERLRTTEQGGSPLGDRGKQVKCLLFHLHSSQYFIFIINMYIFITQNIIWS